MVTRSAFHPVAALAPKLDSRLLIAQPLLVEAFVIPIPSRVGAIALRDGRKQESEPADDSNLAGDG